MKYEDMALQHPEEIAEFCKMVRGERCKSYLEIGSKYGGSLWRVGQVLEPGSRIVAIDLPGGTKKWYETEQSLKDCAEALRSMGHLVTLIWGNSNDDKVIAQVQEIAPFDLVMIDGDHRMAGLSIDWHNYGPMGNMIAFHDIAWTRPEDWQGYSRIDVPELWQKLRNRYRSVEIRLDPTKTDNGIGVLWQEGADCLS